MAMHSKLKQIAKSIVSSKSCPICLNKLQHQTAAVLIPCMHAYCITCIRTWSHVKLNCPLCKSLFNSCFTQINFSSQTFHKLKLSAFNQAKIVNSSLVDPRLIRRRRRREEVNSFGSRTRPLPWRRSFGENDSVMSWRATVYEERLQAVPLSSKNSLMQNMDNRGAKEKMLQRIEPWIRRELQAILGDPDPSIIVHVATSLYISEIAHSRQRCAGDDFLAPLRPFLHERAEMFWHELRCFAESPLSMQTYDAVVQYESLTNSRLPFNCHHNVDSNPGVTVR